MAHNVIHVVVQVGQHSVVMVRHVYVIANAKHIMLLQKHVLKKQTEQRVQMVYVQVVYVKMIHVHPGHRKHVQQT